MNDSVPADPEVPDLFVLGYILAAWGQELLKQNEDTLIKYCILHLTRKPCTQEMLNSRLHLDTKAGSSVVMSMWRLGLIDAVVPEEVESVQTLQVTPAGVQKYQAMGEILRKKLDEVLAQNGVGRPALDTLLRALDLMVSHRE